jgi:hypothetical protein
MYEGILGRRKWGKEQTTAEKILLESLNLRMC